MTLAGNVCVLCSVKEGKAGVTSLFWAPGCSL